MTNLRVKYKVLKEIVTLMGLWEWMAFGLGAYFIGAKEFQSSLIFFVLMGISYYISTKLGYTVLELLVKLQGKEK